MLDWLQPEGFKPFWPLAFDQQAQAAIKTEAKQPPTPTGVAAVAVDAVRLCEWGGWLSTP
ncbi:hypothetical protein E4O93_16155 [Diaphorobacter sp. DS2]|nr:hypothetical protein E4O93_16155 [Diaphorobacter sp. DS2]